MKRKRIIRFFVLLALLAGTGVAGLILFASQDDLPSYRTEPITRGDIVELVSATGTLNPAQVITVGTQVSGQVSKLNVRLNDRVKAGQLLAEIDPTLLLAQIKQDRTMLETARSSLEQAERDLKRVRMLLAKDYVAKVDLEHAEQAYRAAQNTYDGARTVVERDEANLNYTKIMSPIDGVIIAKEIELGQTLAASFQTPNLFRIAADLTKMNISARLPEAFISKVKAGMEATFTVDAFPGREFKGQVSSVNLNPTAEGGIVAYTVEVSVNNSDNSLLPGMTAYVNITLSQRKNVLRVPAMALRFVPSPKPVSGLQRLLLLGRRQAALAIIDTQPARDAKMLYVLRAGTLTPIAVRTGATDETYVEVAGDGIAEGDTVVTGILPVRR